LRRTPKGTLYHYPNPYNHQRLSIAASPAPPKVAQQIYSQATLTQMCLRYSQGEADGEDPRLGGIRVRRYEATMDERPAQIATISQCIDHCFALAWYFSMMPKCSRTDCYWSALVRSALLLRGRGGGSADRLERRWTAHERQQTWPRPSGGCSISARTSPRYVQPLACQFAGHTRCY
jgi:hypothetical protein